MASVARVTVAVNRRLGSSVRFINALVPARTRLLNSSGTVTETRTGSFCETRNSSRPKGVSAQSGSVARPRKRWALPASDWYCWRQLAG